MCFIGMESAGHRNLPLGWRDFLDTLISEVHIKATVRKGACNKLSGRDVICLEIFKVNWDSIKDDMLVICNQTYLDERIIEKQKHGFVLCTPNTDIPSTSANYRPISLVNTDYKISKLEI